MLTYFWDPGGNQVWGVGRGFGVWLLGSWFGAATGCLASGVWKKYFVLDGLSNIAHRALSINSVLGSCFFRALCVSEMLLMDLV